MAPSNHGRCSSLKLAPSSRRRNDHRGISQTTFRCWTDDPQFSGHQTIFRRVGSIHIDQDCHRFHTNVCNDVNLVSWFVNISHCFFLQLTVFLRHLALGAMVRTTLIQLPLNSDRVSLDQNNCLVGKYPNTDREHPSRLGWPSTRKRVLNFSSYSVSEPMCTLWSSYGVLTRVSRYPTYVKYEAIIRQQQPKTTNTLDCVITTIRLYEDLAWGLGLADLFRAELLLLFSFLDDVDAVDLDLSLLFVAADVVFLWRA